MGLTQRVKSINRDRRPGRLVIRADDPSLTPYAGLAISGELARKLRLVELINAELAATGGWRRSSSGGGGSRRVS